MARNTYGGNCYRCGVFVAPGTGYFEKRKDGPGFRVQHCYHNRDKGVTCERAAQLVAEARNKVAPAPKEQ